MASRQLLNVAPRNDQQRHGNFSGPFKLQAPPLKRREKRKARLFHTGLSDSDKVDTIVKPSLQAISDRHQGQYTLSPKDVSHGSAQSCLRSMFDGDDEDDHSNVTSGEITPRAVHFPILPPSSVSCNKEFSASVGSASSNDSPHSNKTPSTHGSAMTNGTFGVLRRRSSVSHSNGGDGSNTGDSYHSTSSSTAHSATSPTVAHEAYTSATDACSPQHHTVLCLSPMSPLSPGRRAALHTPKHAIDTHFNDRLAVPPPGSGGQTKSLRGWSAGEVEPLSATLKRLGAARTSHRFAAVAEDEEGDAADERTPFGFAELMSSKLTSDSPHAWALRMGQRMNEQRCALGVLEEHREAAIRAAPLLRVHRSTPPPEVSGDLDTSGSAGISIDSTLASIGKSAGTMSYDDSVPSIRTGIRVPNPGRSAVQSTVRCGRRESVWHTVRRTSNTLAAYIFGNAQRPRATPTEVFFPIAHDDRAPITKRGDTRCSKGGGDGWGGMRPRSSWFADLRLGPLLSPTAPSSTGQVNGASSSNMRAFHLRPTAVAINSESEWVDEELDYRAAPVETLMRKPMSGLSCVHEEKPPRLMSDAVLRHLRVRFPSQLPAPKQEERRRQAEKDAAHCSAASATVVTYTNNSAEGRPTTKTSREGGTMMWSVASMWTTPRARRLAALLVILAVTGAVAGVVLLLVDRSKNHTISVPPPQTNARRNLVMDAVVDARH